MRLLVVYFLFYGYKQTKKQEIIAKLAGVMKSAKTLVFVNFKGLKVSDSVTLRNNLKAEKVDYYVAKKNFAQKSFSGK